MKKTKETKEQITITIHLPIDKEMDTYLAEIASREERSKIQQIRFILNEYRKKNPINQNVN